MVMSCNGLFIHFVIPYRLMDCIRQLWYISDIPQQTHGSCSILVIYRSSRLWCRPRKELYIHIIDSVDRHTKLKFNFLNLVNVMV